MWNAFEDVQAGLQTTNNSLEGWHKGFDVFVDETHPDLFLFISKLKAEQSQSEMLIGNYIAGKRLPPHRQLDQLRHNEIRNSVERYYTFSMWKPDEYLMGIAEKNGYL